MMELGEVLAYLREVLPHENAEMTAHMISRNRERTIGLFQGEARTARQTAIGGKDNCSYDVVRLTLLLRWGRDGGAAERKAAEIYAILSEGEFCYDGRSGFIRAVNAMPLWLGMDERGVFEYVIDFDICLNKEGKDGIPSK